MSLHHKLCHTLGGSFDLPHAETHTVVLPHALAYNRPAARMPSRALSRALGGAPTRRARCGTSAGALGAPRSLRELGMAEADIPASSSRRRHPYANPRPVTPDGGTALLRNAWAGTPHAIRHTAKNIAADDLEAHSRRRHAVFF